MSTPFMIGKANAPFKLLPKHSVTQFKNRLYKKYRRLRSLTGRLLYLQVSSTVCLLHLVWQGSSKLQILISATVKKLYHMRFIVNTYSPIKNKTVCTKAQTVAKPHSPSLYGESISALLTTSLGCTTASTTLGTFFPPGRKNNNINKGDCQCSIKCLLIIATTSEVLPYGC